MPNLRVIAVAVGTALIAAGHLLGITPSWVLAIGIIVSIVVLGGDTYNSWKNVEIGQNNTK